MNVTFAEDPSWDTLARLPAPHIQQLQSKHQDQPDAQNKGRFTAAVAMGNALTGSAIAVLNDTGQMDLLLHPRTARSKVGTMHRP